MGWANVFDNAAVLAMTAGWGAEATSRPWPDPASPHRRPGERGREVPPPSFTSGVSIPDRAVRLRGHHRGAPGYVDQVGGWACEPARGTPYGTKSAAEVEVVHRNLSEGAASDG